MDLLLFMCGAIGFIISIVFLIINMIRKKDKKKPLIAGGVCLLVFIISLSMPTDATKDAVQTNITKDAKQTEISPEDKTESKEISKSNSKEKEIVDTEKKEETKVKEEATSKKVENNTVEKANVNNKAEVSSTPAKEVKAENKTFTLKFGELLDSTINDDVLVIKAKIEPSYSNKTTISQNGFNIEDLILNQDADKYKEIQYWAVANMQDGSESKVVSFTVDKSLIDSIKNKNVVGNQIVDNAKDVWILQSLMQ